MGTSSNKEQKIELHLIINLDKNRIPGQKYIASVKPNNPSAIINISDINSETTETTEISQNNPINQSVENSQNSVNNQNVNNSQNNQNNVINDVSAPLPFDSYQKSSINSSTNQQFNINKDGAGNQPVDKEKKYTNTNEGNIDKNIGGGIREKNETYDKQTDQGNIDKNIGGGIREKNETYDKQTDQGNIDKNIGGGIREKNETPNEAPNSLNTAKIGYGLDNNDSNEPLGFNGNLNIIDKNKAFINKKVEEGYFPLFFQLDKEKPLFMFIKNYETIQNLLEEYKNLKGINGNNKEYTLYNKKTKSVIAQDVPIKDLGISFFAYISNNI